MTNQTVIDTLSNNGLPPAADVVSYTDKQLKQLAIHFRVNLITKDRGKDRGYDKEVRAWFKAIGTKKYTQFKRYIFDSVRDCKVRPDWMTDADFVLNETKGV